MPRYVQSDCLIRQPILSELGITTETIKRAIEHTYLVVDSIDEKLVENDQPRLADLVELANLSAIVGNLFRSGFEKASDGKYFSNAPHTYPDLLSTDPEIEGIEIKVALETNKPKGHLVKPGIHLTLRYVLGNMEGQFNRGKDNRGDVIWIWEIRVGYLDSEHFSVSNTEGDSGKTAVITSAGMDALSLAFCQLDKIPYARNGRVYRELSREFSNRE